MIGAAWWLVVLLAASTFVGGVIVGLAVARRQFTEFVADALRRVRPPPAPAEPPTSIETILEAARVRSMFYAASRNPFGTPRKLPPS